jgi:hypothetical protein
MREITRPLDNILAAVDRIGSGLVFDVADSQGQPDALEALHRRVTVEQLAWPARVGSP